MAGTYTDADVGRYPRTGDELRREVRDLQSQNVDLRMKLQRQRFQRKTDGMLAMFYLVAFALDALVIALRSGHPHLAVAVISLIPALVIFPLVTFLWD
jgi:hypothetical protein